MNTSLKGRDADAAAFQELTTRNKQLSGELQACINDKEFVWHLWKECQVSNPNTANIVNSVLEREQEKSDIKAAKVLTVLQEKDQQINILQEISADLQIQLKHANERVSELLIKESDWINIEQEYDKELNHLKTEINDKKKQDMLKNKQADEIEENAKQQIVIFEKKIEEVSIENSTLQQKLASLNNSLENAQKVKESLKKDLLDKDQLFLDTETKLNIILKEKEILSSENIIYKEIAKKAEKNVKKKGKEDERSKEYWEEEIKNNIVIIDELKQNLEQIQQENLSLKKDVKGHTTCTQRIQEQEQLIKNLKFIQDESQNIYNQQQVANEAETNLCKKKIKDLKKKVNELQEVAKRNNENIAVSSIRGGREFNHLKNVDNKICQTSFSIDDIRAELYHAKNVHESTPVLMDCNKDIDRSNNIECNGNGSINPVEDTENYERLVNLVNSLEDELQTIRSAHKQRLQRYKLLEENCDLLQQQLATYEDKAVKKPIVRASAKSLQQEGSRSVWNELEYYKQLYEKYKWEKPKVDEELAQLKVKHSQNITLISKLKLETENLRKVTCQKDIEHAQKENTRLKDASKLKLVEEEIQVFHWKIKDLEEDNIKLQEACDLHIENEKNMKAKISVLNSKIDSLQKVNVSNAMKDKITQTDLNIDLKNLIHEAILDVIPTSKSDSSIATQTISVEMDCIEIGTQTFETNKLSEQEEYKVRKSMEEEREKLMHNHEQLSISENNLLAENKKLKSKQTSLKKEIKRYTESEEAYKRNIDNLEDTIKKLKSEILESLQMAKETNKVVEEKSKAADEYSRNLEIALTNEQKGKIDFKNKLKEIKTLAKQLAESTATSSRLSVQVKALTQENEMLTEKQNMFQARIGKVEKDLFLKKNLSNDMKLKLEEAKNELSQNNAVTDNLKLKLKAVTEGEKNKKVYIDELKMKMDVLVKENFTLQNSISLLKEENNNKTELLQKTQRLCHQAEIALNDVERSSCTQLDNNKKSPILKNNKTNTQTRKYLQQIKEFKSVLKNFSEAMLQKSCRNHNIVVERKKQRKKREIKIKENSLFGNKSIDNACSILGMSTQDLVEFMNEETSDGGESFNYDKNMRENLEVILKKEEHFEKPLIDFLLDLVKFNENLFQQQLDPELVR